MHLIVNLRQLLLVAAMCLAVAACGGGSDETADAIDSAPDVESTVAAPTEPPATVAIPTSTPLPTATALPANTPVPLEEPTPSAVLLTTAFTNSSKVTTVGIDEVFFGMTPDEAAEAASTTWVAQDSPSATCYRVSPADGPDGVTLWVVDGHLERLDVEHPDIRTRSRLGVGNSLAELQSQIGDRLTDETNADGVVVATFAPTDPGDREFRMIFELVDDRVVRYRSGRIGIIQRDVAGC